MNNRLAMAGAIAALALTATAGILDDIAATVEKAKNEYAEKQAQKANAVSDAELLRMVRDQYEKDMASGQYSRWHGTQLKQIVLDGAGETNLAHMVRIFADGFTVTNAFHKSKPRTDAERKIYQAKIKAEVTRKRIEALKKQVEEMKAGVPLAALEAQIAALENKLNGATVTNIVKTIGSNKGGDQ